MDNIELIFDLETISIESLKHFNEHNELTKNNDIDNSNN